MSRAKEIPQPPAECDPGRYADDDPHDRGHRGLPGDCHRQLSAGEAKRLQHGEVAPTASDRGCEHDAKRHDRAGGEARGEDCRSVPGRLVVDYLGRPLHTKHVVGVACPLGIRGHDLVGYLGDTLQRCQADGSRDAFSQPHDDNGRPVQVGVGLGERLSEP
jgi:hypothetical protein